MDITFLIQVDTLAHQIPNFITKARARRLHYAFIGLESINPDNLVHMKKNQNRITEYRKMFQAWKEAGIVTYAGFIMGLPGDTPASIKRDVEIVQRELRRRRARVHRADAAARLGGSPDALQQGRLDGSGPEQIRHRERDDRASEDDAPRSGSRPISTSGTGTTPTSTSRG